MNNVYKTSIFKYFYKLEYNEFSWDHIAMINKTRKDL